MVFGDCDYNERDGENDENNGKNLTLNGLREGAPVMRDGEGSAMSC